ncbi:hypothetical protein DITRI_Ditri13aG0115800 [Diplodiscus trichospermus]
MVSHTIHSWTLIGLFRAFLDLALAYFLLCGSTLGFFACKFCYVFGLHLSCPCSGFLGYQNSNLCWHKLLIQWPARKIYSVQKLVLNRFPFNLVLFDDQELNSDVKFITDGKFCNGVVKLEGEAYSASPSGLRLQTMVDKESGYDAKGKKLLNQKQKSGIRRRRRSAFGYGKSSPVLLYDEKTTQTGTDIGEETWHGFELSNGEEEGSTFLKRFTRSDNEKYGISGDETDRNRILEQALEKENAKYAALYLELEKERAAAASAADEAMAMILRIQEDKASVEMEARQYQRMIEEKFAYDEEEMNILKEILVRREKENHLLEKEVEAYKQIDTLGHEQECDFSYTLSKGGSVSLGIDEDPLLMVNEMGNGGSTGRKEEEKGSSWPSKKETLDGNRSRNVAVNLAGKGDGQDDDAIVCQAIATKTAQSFGGIQKNSLCAERLNRSAEFKELLGSNMHDSTLDTEPAIYDIHVVDDDEINVTKEENKKESILPTCSASDDKSLLYDLGKSSSAVINERLEIDAEIEHFRERLRIVRGEKEKLTFSADQRERVDSQLKLIEEMVNQLQEFQLLKEPL